jgi:hypothetical protein
VNGLSKTRVVLLSILALLSTRIFSQEISTSHEPVEDFFEGMVEPILVNRCLECHGEKREGELDLRTRLTALKGGENGVVLQPGNPEKSKLYEMIYDEKMPPKKSLSDDEVDILKDWIENGLYYPAEPLEPLPYVEDWWSLVPLQPPVLSDTGSKAGAQIDQLIRKTLNEKGLTPSAPATPRTVIRRITYDLHGLPPTPEEIDSFVQACIDETGVRQKVGDRAYADLVDRLLDSPRYGERWARHWLDIAHYGETHGFDKDQRRNNAWPYRDYVIRAFNEDKPYAEFVTEQIAGDVINPGMPDGIVATGFLAAGPWDQVGQTEVKEGTIEKKRVRNLDRDDIVTNVFNTFQSTTVQCARCHNHKFDPIPRAEYYKLQAVFSGIDRADRDYEAPIDAKRRAYLDTEMKTIKEKFERTKNTIIEGLPEEYEKVQKDLARLHRKKDSLQPKEKKPQSPSNGFHSVVTLTPDEKQWVEIDLEDSLPLNELTLVPARPTDYEDTPGFGFPIRFKVSISNTEKSDEFQSIADHTQANYPNPGNTPVIFDLNGQHVRRIRIEAVTLWERNKDYAFALAEVEAISDGQNVALDKPVTAGSSIDFGRWHTRFLVDGYDSRQPRAVNQTSKSERLLAVESEIEALEKLSQKLVKRYTKKALLNAKATEEYELKNIENAISELPDREQVYSVRSIEPRIIHDLPRGNEATPDEPVSPAALSLIPSLSEKLEFDSKNEAISRKEMAAWLVDPENALTWRSIVNRVWQYHFGRGIVDTPNDFGRAGSLPTHPEILEWLANEFRETQSLKTLHRTILNSATYRQSSKYQAANAAIDGSNQFLWRMNPRKLDAESVHDSILSISGKLDLAMGGPSYEAFNYTHDHSPKYDFLGKDSPDVWRRSVYRFIVRSVPDPLFEALDCADPNMNTPVRNETLTAPQALAMLNDAFILRQAEHTAGRLKNQHSELSSQINHLYLLAIGRNPDSEEMNTLKKFTRQYGLASLARLTFNLNEFMFVD